METNVINKDGVDVYKVQYYIKGIADKQTSFVPMNLEPLTLTSIKNYIEENNKVTVVDKPAVVAQDKKKSTKDSAELAKEIIKAQKKK